MKILNNKAGVTVLEGVIALGLLAVVTAGAFGVLLSAARKSSQPDMREEMTLAVEQAKDRLQVYLHYDEGNGHLPEGLKRGLCGGETGNPLSSGEHQIRCLLPDICDRHATDSSGNFVSKFSYKVTSKGLSEGGLDNAEHDQNINGNFADMSLLQIEFSIACNGYEL